MHDPGYDVALSFAGEDRAAAEALASALVTRGITVFYDGFEKADLWGTDLYAYLSDVYQNRARYCVMFLSAHYARNAWTHHERKAAQARAFRERQEYILPIRLDRTEIPGVLPTVGYVEWASETPDSVARMIAGKLGRKGAPERKTIAALPPSRLINVPRLPPHLLYRTRQMERLRISILRKPTDPRGVIPDARRIGLHGMGGIGKSVLAATLAHDISLAGAFPDGIAWLTLGRTPRVESRIADLCFALEGSRVELPDLPAWSARLDYLLQGRTMLLILDDVWTAEHAEAFGTMGGGSCLLITTRDASVLTALGAEAHAIDILSEDDSLELLALACEQKRETLPPEAALVARECGHLPLALAVVGAMGRGVSGFWPSVLQRLQAADFRALRHKFPHYPYPELLKALHVSVEDLGREAMERFYDLVVFPGGAKIPAAALFTLWNECLGDLDKRLLLRALVDKSLVRSVSDDLYTLHDLYVDYLRGQVSDPPARHARLLDGYAKRADDGWVSGPDDGYYFQHVVSHLVAADRSEEAHRLVTGSSHWNHAKRRASSWDGSLLADVDLLLEGYSDPLHASDLPKFFALLMVRMVLQMEAEQFRDIDLRLMTLLGRKGETFSFARLRRNWKSRVQGLLSIAGALRESGAANESLLDEIVATAQPLDEIYEGTLIDLVRELYLSGDERYRSILGALHDRVVAAATANKYPYEQFRLLAPLGLLLAEIEDEQAERVLRDVVDLFGRIARTSAQGISTLGKRLVVTLAKAGLFGEAHRVVRNLSASNSADFDDDLAAKLLLARALDQAGEPGGPELRAKVEERCRWWGSGSYECALGMAEGLARSDDEAADHWFRVAVEHACAIDRHDDGGGPEDYEMRALQQVAGVMVATGRLSQALEVIKMIPVGREQRGHYSVAEGLALAGDPRAAAIFDEILEASSMPSPEGDQVVIKKALIAAVVAGHAAAAVALRKIGGAGESADALIRAGIEGLPLQWDRDREMIDAAGWNSTIPSSLRGRPSGTSGSPAGLTHRFRDMEFTDPAALIAEVAELAPMLEEQQRGLSFATLRECMRIASWIQWRWREAYALISEPA